MRSAHSLPRSLSPLGGTAKINNLANTNILDAPSAIAPPLQQGLPLWHTHIPPFPSSQVSQVEQQQQQWNAQAGVAHALRTEALKKQQLEQQQLQALARAVRASVQQQGQQQHYQASPHQIPASSEFEFVPLTAGQLS